MNTGTSAVTLSAIGDIAEVRPGLSIEGRMEHVEGGSHQLILSRHLTPGAGYRFTESDRFSFEPGRDADRYRVQPGDVLFMSRGARNVASWLEEVPERSVAPVSFYVLRPGADIDAAYLTWWLNQPAAQRAISDIRTGAGTPLVQRKPFAELRLPLPDRATQRTVACLGAAMVQERTLLERLSASTQRQHDLTNERIARELLARAELNQ
ncbi:MAG: restriction endonuclease subunit S [Gemmatimonadetes bacterium]|nr:restriction endonuclease subunit S [Gemmatimonadota bacterium]